MEKCLVKQPLTVAVHAGGTYFRSNCVLSIPSSKSHTHRAILFASMAHGKSTIYNYLPSSDSEKMINACRAFGAHIETTMVDGLPTLIIYGTAGKIHYKDTLIDVGNSGIALRFCSALATLSSTPVIISGDYSICHQRPMLPLIDALSCLGANIKSVRGDGFAPVVVSGPLILGAGPSASASASAMKVEIDGIDSQFVSALLIATAFAKNNTKKPFEIIVHNPGEKPWVNLTLNWFEKLGISCTNINQEFNHYLVDGNASYDGFTYVVPSDLSSAAFPLAVAVIASTMSIGDGDGDGDICLENIDMDDCQGDKELIYLLINMGANIEIDKVSKRLLIKMNQKTKLYGTTIDINNFIDAITILSVIACFAEGETVLTNARVARKKECDRISCLVGELKKMGADIKETSDGDGLIIKKSKLRTGATLFSHHDHRLAMSLIVAALFAEGEATTTVTGCECIKKTYPNFTQTLHAFGAKVDLEGTV